MIPQRTNAEAGICPCLCQCGVNCDHTRCPCPECKSARGDGRMTETLLCGDGCTFSPSFGEFKHSDFQDPSEDGTIENVDEHILRLYRAKYRNVRFNRHDLVISYEQ